MTHTWTREGLGIIVVLFSRITLAIEAAFEIRVCTNKYSLLHFFVVVLV